MNPKGLVLAASITSQMSMSIRSERRASSFTRAMLTLRKMFSNSFDISAARGEETTWTWANNWVVNRPLAQWVKRQRYQYVVKQQLLKQGTIEHPKSMVEDEVEDCWTFGPTGSLDTTNNKSKTKRGGMKRSTLTDEREKALEKIGFVWSTHNALWEEKYNELAAFFHKHGHCNVPSKYPSNNKLSVWVRCQRRQYRLLKNNPINISSENKSSMTMERIDRLKAIKFNFNPRNLKM